MRAAVALAPLLSSLLFGCRAPAPEPVADGGRMEWQGLQACADCDAIETVLTLERSGDAQPYRLTETYLTGGGGEPFVDDGEWRLDSGLIRLQGEAGSVRTYAVLPDGRLQSRDADGGRVRGGGHVLQPVSGVGP